MIDIVIRCAEGTVDFQQIASCIYLTDPFIYPAAFGPDIRQAANAISKLMSIEDGLFHPNNLVIAVHGEKICGILLYNKDGAAWNRSECIDLVQGIVPSIKNFCYVSDAYFSAEAISPPKKHIEIVACCVMPEFRKMGISKCMFDWLIKEYIGYTFTLDVLAENLAAISLYKKYGFLMVEEHKGFSLEEATRPDCYRMLRHSCS